MDIVEGAEDPLLKHIRQLLLNYVVANITTDYIQLTEDAVTDASNLQLGFLCFLLR